MFDGILLLISFPISIPIYCLSQGNFFKGMLKWLEHIFESFYGRYWKSIDYVNEGTTPRIKLL